MKLRDIMTKDVVRVEPDATIAWVISKMKHFRIRSLIVERASEDRPYGIITIRDVVYRVIAKGLDPAIAKVGEIMSKPAICVRPDMEIRDAIQFMTEKNLDRVLVCTKENNLVGIASLFDILKAF